MDILNSRTILTVLSAVAVQSIASPIPDFPQELYFFPYVFGNAALVYVLASKADAWNIVIISLIGTNAIFLLTLTLLTVVRRLYLSPLSKFPGSKLGAVTGLWNANEARLGRIPRTYRALHEKYQSDVIRVGPNEVSVRNADAIGRIYKGKHPRGNFNQVFNLVGGDTIATVRDYKRHTLWRRVWDKSLNGTEITRYLERMKLQVEKSVNYLYEKDGEAVESGNLFDALVYDVLLDLTFSDDIGLQPIAGQRGFGDRTFVDLLHNFVRLAGVVGHLPSLQQIFRYLPTSAEGRAVNRIGNNLIAERKARKTDQKDFFHHFESSGVFTQEELKLQVLTVITAGADTVTKALNQIIALLASRPDIQERIRGEIREAYKDDGVPPTEILRTLQYLDGVIKEGLRLFSPLFRGAPANAPKDGVTLDTGDFIPPDTQIWISQYLVMTDERNFSRADEFLPERWINDESEEGNKLIKDRRAWFPFGNGAHSCPGKALAMAEMRYIISCLLTEFDIVFQETEGKPFNYKKWAANWKDFFAVETDELYLKFVPRKPAGTER